MANMRWAPCFWTPRIRAESSAARRTPSSCRRRTTRRRVFTTTPFSLAATSRSTTEGSGSGCTTVAPTAAWLPLISTSRRSSAHSHSVEAARGPDTTGAGGRATGTGGRGVLRLKGRTLRCPRERGGGGCLRRRRRPCLYPFVQALGGHWQCGAPVLGGRPAGFRALDARSRRSLAQLHL